MKYKFTGPVVPIDDHTDTRIDILFVIRDVKRLCARDDMQGADPLKMLHNWAICYKAKRKEARNGHV